MTFYDDYNLDLDSNGQPDYAPQAIGSTPAPLNSTQVRGLTTVTRRRVIQPNGQFGVWLTTVLFYDEYGNLIQKQSNNLQQTGSTLADITTLEYRSGGFVPQALRSIKTQQTGRAYPVVVRNRFAYDAAGRTLQAWQQHQYLGQWEPEVLVANYRYAALGQMTQKRLHSRDQGVRFLQYEDFTYNLHGQLTSINNGSLRYNNENDLFGLSLVREQTNAMSTGNTPRYDGGISAATWMVHNAANPQTPLERERSYRFTYDGLGRLNAATYAARVNPWESWTLEQGAYDEKNITYDANGNIGTVERWTQRDATSPKELIDDLFLYYGSTPTSGNRLAGVYDYQGDARGFKQSPTGNWTDYTYDTNGSITHDGNKGVDYTFNTLNKVEKQTVGSGSINYTYDAAGTVLKREVSSTAGLQTEYYVDGLVYEVSPTFSGLRSVPTPEGRALVVQQSDTKLTYEYHLRDHLNNLRVAFRAQAGTETLQLSSENPDREEGPYPKFENVAVTQSQDWVALPAHDGSYVAAVTNASGTPATPGHSAVLGGPAIAIPVAHGDHLQVRVFCKTPYGIQYFRNAQPPIPTLPKIATLLAPAIIPNMAPVASDGNTSPRLMPGVQLSISGLLGAAFTGIAKKTALAARPPSGGGLDAFLVWTLTNINGQVVRSGSQAVPVYTDNQWHQLDLPLDIDLSSEESRTGTLRVQEVNQASNPVYFDLLTISHPKDQALISQENHYYPMGLPMSGVAVSSIPAPKTSKQLFNGGSDLQDELLGAEGGVYSTFYRTYDPATGRFTGVDPLADHYLDWSPYQFALGNPISASDPTGAMTVQEFFDIIKRLTDDADRASGGGSSGYSGWSAEGGFTGPGTFSGDGLGGWVISRQVPIMNMMSDGHGTYIQVATDWTRTVQTPWAAPVINLAHGFSKNDESFSFEDHVGMAVNFIGAGVSAGGILADRNAVEAAAGTRFLGYASADIKSSANGIKWGGRALGAVGLAWSAYQYKTNDGSISAGEWTKLLVGTGLIFVSAPVAIGYLALDITVGLATGVSLTDRIGNSVDSIFATPKKP